MLYLFHYLYNPIYDFNDYKKTKQIKLNEVSKILSEAVNNLKCFQSFFNPKFYF